MNQRKKVLLLLVAFALVLAVSSLAYRALSENARGEQLQIMEPAAQDPARPEEDSPQEGPEGEQPAGGEGEEEAAAPAAPDFQMYDEEGNMVMLSDFRGKPVVVNFWASWCPPCKGEMPEFDEVYREVGEEVQFLMVDLVDGSQETQEMGRDYVQSQGYSFPVYYDLDRAGGYAYGVTSIPSTYFVDAQGRIAAGARGAINREQLLYGIELAKAAGAAGEELEAGEEAALEENGAEEEE